MHLYEAVKKDYNLAVRLNPKYIMFHNIVDKYCPGVVRFWGEIKRDHKDYKEITDCKDLMGFGIIEL